MMKCAKIEITIYSTLREYATKKSEQRLKKTEAKYRRNHVRKRNERKKESKRVNKKGFHKSVLPRHQDNA